MTPFGQKVRALRTERGVDLKDMADALQISSAYLSALERGRKGRPSPMLVRQICNYFNIIWDEAEELERLAALSHPRVTIDTTDLSAQKTELANRLAERIDTLDVDTVKELLSMIDRCR